MTTKKLIGITVMVLMIMVGGFVFCVNSVINIFTDNGGVIEKIQNVDRYTEHTFNAMTSDGVEITMHVRMLGDSYAVANTAMEIRKAYSRDLGIMELTVDDIIGRNANSRKVANMSLDVVKAVVYDKNSMFKDDMITEVSCYLVESSYIKDSNGDICRMSYDLRKYDKDNQ